MSDSSVTVCRHKLYKVLVIGDLGVGKSSVIFRYVNKCFDEKYKMSIGVDFALKTIEWDAQTVVRLHLWDIAGHERFKQMSRAFYKGAMGALVVFDIANRSTLIGASEWKQDLDKKLSLDNGQPIPVVLLANKCDMSEKDEELLASLDNFCKENRFVGWFETSAKKGINIDEAGAFLVKQMMLCDTGPSNEMLPWDRITARQAPEESQIRPWCC